MALVPSPLGDVQKHALGVKAPREKKKTANYSESVKKEQAQFRITQKESSVETELENSRLGPGTGKNKTLKLYSTYQLQTQQPVYTGYSKLDEIRLITVGVASSNRILQWAEKTLPNGKIVGEVTNANTLHHKTFKPVKGGLFCERIFGPLKDFECACSSSLGKKIKKYKKNSVLARGAKTNTGLPSLSTMKNAELESPGNSSLFKTKRFFCPACDVEYTWSVIRRYQLGYIKLNAPVTHVWYVKGNPSYISLLLDMKKKHVEYVTYCTETLTLENALKFSVENLYTLSETGAEAQPSQLYSLWQKVKNMGTNSNWQNTNLPLSLTPGRLDLLPKAKIANEANFNKGSTVKKSFTNRLVANKALSYYLSPCSNTYSVTLKQDKKILPTLSNNKTDESDNHNNLSVHGHGQAPDLGTVGFNLVTTKRIKSLKKDIKGQKRKTSVPQLESRSLVAFYKQASLEASLQASSIGSLIKQKQVLLNNTSIELGNKGIGVLTNSTETLKKLPYLFGYFLIFVKFLKKSKKQFNQSLMPLSVLVAQTLEHSSGLLKPTLCALAHRDHNTKLAKLKVLVYLGIKHLQKNAPGVPAPVPKGLTKSELILAHRIFAVQSALNVKAFARPALPSQVHSHNSKKSFVFLSQSHFYNLVRLAFISKVTNQSDHKDFSRDTLARRQDPVSGKSPVQAVFFQTLSASFRTPNPKAVSLGFNEPREKKRNYSFSLNAQKSLLLNLVEKNGSRIHTSPVAAFFSTPRRFKKMFLLIKLNQLILKKLGKLPLLINSRTSIQHTTMIANLEQSGQKVVSHCLTTFNTTTVSALYNDTQSRNASLSANRLGPVTGAPRNNFFTKGFNSLCANAHRQYLKYIFVISHLKNQTPGLLEVNPKGLKNTLGANEPREKQNLTQKQKAYQYNSNLKLNKLVNNIYCLSHRVLWDNEKDWQFFAFYYYGFHSFIQTLNETVQNAYAPRDNQSTVTLEHNNSQSNKTGQSLNQSVYLDDVAVPVYSYRNYSDHFSLLNNFFSPSQSSWNVGPSSTMGVTSNQLTSQLHVSFSGAGMIKTLLADFNYLELKKMDKQNRILLYDLNKYIRKIKKQVTQNKKLVAKALKEACKQRDVLIRRTKYIRKIFRNYVSFSLGASFENSSNYTIPNPNTEGLSQYRDSKATEQLNTNTSNNTNLANTGHLADLVLEVLPVLPPDLRPIVKMGSQIAASDLNRLYQRVIYRNDRLKKFLKNPATNGAYEMKYGQRLLQEAVDNLIQNGKSGVVPEKDARGRALKSLSDILKGKQGRFRQYLLGKRVDYSGRSVIVVGPKLKLHECGIPKEMALELYLPFLIKAVLNNNLARTVIGAKALIQTNKPLTWALLREILKTCPVLLNRAPTLHRLGFQAFQPKLVDGRAILLHPLVCPSFNADFDGDQMAVHVPISTEARAEAWKLMLSRNNLLSPATGEPLVLPSQDMVLGCYYLTTNGNKRTQEFEKGFGFYFDSLTDVLRAYNQGLLSIHAIIWVKWNSSYDQTGPVDAPLEIRLNTSGSTGYVIYPKSYKTFKLSKQNPSNSSVTFANKESTLLYGSLNTLNLCAVANSNSNKWVNELILGNRIIRTTPGKILFNVMIQKALFSAQSK